MYYFTLFSGLPPLAVISKGEVKFEDVVDHNKEMAILRSETEPPTIFAINRNLFVQVKIINCKLIHKMEILEITYVGNFFLKSICIK
jgi:hypothetical protein